MLTFQWYNRRDLVFLIKLPLIMAAVFAGASLMKVNPYFGIAATVLSFFAADRLGNRPIALICPERSISGSSQTLNNGADQHL
jgi:hypothetical protein